LKYASAAWDPSSKNHVSIMENEQTDAVRLSLIAKEELILGGDKKCVWSCLI